MSLLAVLFSQGAASASSPSSFAPLTSPLYRAVDALWSAGLLPAPHLGERPVSEDALAARVREAVERDPARASAALRAAGLGPQGFVTPETRRGRWTTETRWTTRTQVPHVGAKAEPELRKVRPWSVTLEAAEVDSGRGLAGFRSGGFTDDGVAGIVEFGWSDAFLGRGRADLRARFRASRIDTQGRLLVAVARWRLGAVDLTAGREPLWLGPGRQSALLLSNEAPPYEHVRLSPVAPGRLPGFLDGLGTVGYQFSLGRLAERRVDFDNPLLLGMRVSVAPASWLELAGTRTVLFGGSGRLERFRLRDVWDLLLGLNENKLNERDPSDNDQIAGVDATVALPFLSRVPGLLGGRVFIEYAGEDNLGPGFLPTAVAHNRGGELLTRFGSLRTEITETVDDGIFWYRHRIFTEGYRYRDRILGHAEGGDMRGGVFEAEAPVGDRATLSARYEEWRHGFEFGERRTEIRRTVRCALAAGPGAISLSYGWRTAFGPLTPEEAKSARGDLVLTYDLLGD